MTSTVYDGNDNVVMLIAHVAHVSTYGDRDQVTRYIYGVPPGSVGGTTVESDLWSNDLLLKTIYPEERGTGAATEAERTVWMGYNRQGDVVAMEDQNDTLHEYTLDKLGRVIVDEVTLGSGSLIDDLIVSIETDFDDAGRVSSVRSRSSDSGNPVVNEVEFGYTGLWQVERVWQHSKGEVTYDGNATDDDPTGDTRLVRQEFVSVPVSESGASVNYSRLSELVYPRNVNTGSPVTATLEYDYGVADSPGDIISRVAGLSLDSTDIVKYAYVGSGLFTLVDYVVPDVQLDRTLSHDGKRRYDSGSPTQAAGVYPALDRFGRIIRQAWADGNLTTQSPLAAVPNLPTIVELGYSYDEAGSRTAAVDLRPGNEWPTSWEYTYDDLNRLTVANRGTWDGSALQSQAGSQQWTLDLLGNWDQWKFDSDLSGSFSAAETEDRTHNGVNELLDRNQGSGGTDEALTYDLAGNLSTRVANSVTTTYTHDAWNRLVRVEVGSNTLLEQQHNGLTWRTWKRSDTDLDGDLDEERTFTYGPSWQLLEERIDADFLVTAGLDRRVQLVWGMRYIDDAVLHRRDNNNDGGYGGTNEGTWYHVTDAMYSTVAILWPTGNVAERVSYTPYGEARHHFGGDINGDGECGTDELGIVLGAWGESIGDASYRSEADLNFDGIIDGGDLVLVLETRSALPPGLISDASANGPDNSIGWDGYVFNAETRMYTVRHRTYLPVLGRWGERDPIRYGDGMNLYQTVQSSPVQYSDPSGLRARVGACAGINNGGENYVERHLRTLGILCDASLNRRSRLGVDPRIYTGDDNVLLDSKGKLDAEAKAMAGGRGALCDGTNRQRVQVLMISPKTQTSPCDVFSGAGSGTVNGAPSHSHGCCDIEFTTVFDPYDPVPNQAPFSGEWNGSKRWTRWDEYGRVIPILSGNGPFSDPFLRHSLEHYLICGQHPIIEWDPNYNSLDCH